MNELMHYAPKPIGLVREWPYVQNEPSTFGKPVGFWVSIPGEDDWPTWCTDNEFGEGTLTAAHRVTLAPDANVHVITSSFELDAFTGIYAVQTDYDRRWEWRVNDSRKWPIDWRQVAEDCDGIIIAPYQWSRRNQLDWYYGWDCASGCIWNLDAIASVDLIESEVSA